MCSVPGVSEPLMNCSVTPSDSLETETTSHGSVPELASLAVATKAVRSAVL